MEDIDESSIMIDDHKDSLVIVEDSSDEDGEGEVPMDNCDYMTGYT